MASLRRELGGARERVRALEQENATLLYQLESAREAAERLASLPAQPGGGGGGGAADAVADGGEHAARYAESLQRLSAELSRAHHGAKARALGASHASGGGGADGSGADGGAAAEESLEMERVELEASLAVRQAEAAQSLSRLQQAEAQLASVTGQDGGGQRAEPSVVIAAQRRLDEASDALGDAEVAVEQLGASLVALRPRLGAAREQRAELRRRAEGQLVDLERTDAARMRPHDVSSLPEARAIIELLLQRLSQSPLPPLPAGDAAAAGGVAGGGGAMRDSLELQARFEERTAELELVRVEKRRLQQLIDEMKRGNLQAVFRQAQEDAEREVLRRMMSTGVSPGPSP